MKTDKPKYVRFVPRASEWSRYTGWEGIATASNQPEFWNVAWKYGSEQMPTCVHEAHLSFRIKKFSKRFT